jgi:hypothetical protein
MGRRVRRFLIIIPTAVVVLLSLLLATCSNEFDIFEAIKTEMKVANDLFLEIKSVSPEENAPLVNPGVPIVIVFDRSIDPDTANESTILITPAPDPGGPLKSLDFDDYNDNTKTLTIEPVDYMDGDVDYEVRITSGVKGVYGSELQNEVIWSFHTTVYPAGSININGGNDYITNDGTVTLNISYNTEVQWMKYSINATDLEPAGNWVAKSTSVSGFTLEPPGDGVRTVYIKFADNSFNETEVESDTIIRDTADPYFDPLLPDKTINMYSSFPVSIAATVLDDTSGVETYSWTVSPLGAVVFGDSSVEDTTITDVPSDGTFTLTLAVTDKAGNGPATDSLSLTVDRAPPNAPTVTNVTSSPTHDTTPRWSWTSGGGDGNGQYRRSLNGDKWVSTSTTYYEPSIKDPLDYGDYKLEVQEQDAAGNYSVSGYAYILIYPTISPEWGETVNIGKTGSVTLAWQDLGAYSYDVYFGTSSKVLTKVATTSKLSYVKTGLSTGSIYYWGIVAKNSRGSVIYTSPSYRDSDGPFTFRTIF